MARKSESISDKIVRLYREGFTVEEIAKAMEMPKDNVPRILEKHMPDYATFVQPEIEHNTDEKTKKGARGLSVGGLFGKKDKAAEASTAKATINLDMDENGFVDRNAANIAGLLQKGKSIADVAEFFNREIADVKAVSGCMSEHFERQKSPKKAAPAPAPAPAAEEPENKAVHSRPNLFTSGLEEQTEKPVSKSTYTPPTYTRRDEPKPVSASYGLAYDSKSAQQEKVTLVSDAIKEKPVHEVKLVPDDADFSQPAVKPGPVVSADSASKNSEEIPEMPSIDPISLDDLDKELVKAPDPIPEIPDIGYEDNKDADASADAKEDNSGMSAMEKMKKFAEEQIALNNQKIAELQEKKVGAENNAFDCNTKVEAVEKQIEDLKKQLAVLVEEKNKAGEVVSGINDEIESIKKENNDYAAYL